MKENPRYNVISLRLNDEEMNFLQEITKKNNKCISEIVREALSHEMELAVNSSSYTTLETLCKSMTESGEQ
jgi:hypothetical protein